MPILDLSGLGTNGRSAGRSKPTNDSLRQLFVGVDRVVIKKGGVYNGQAMSDVVMLVLDDMQNVQRFSKLLTINEERVGFHCMCMGDHAIELMTASETKEVIGFHHGVSLRRDIWNSDADLAQGDELLSFFCELGYCQPLQDREREKLERSAERMEEQNWFAFAPNCFSQYRKEIIGAGQEYITHLIPDLDKEYPSRTDQVIALLQTFGKTKNFWTAYPIYEELPYDILKTFALEDIINAYLASDRNYKTRRGLGRLLCSHDFKKTRRAHLPSIPFEVIEDLEMCFDAIGEKRGVNEIFQLRNERNKC